MSLPIIELDFREDLTGVTCSGCVSAIEHKLYSLGVTHVEYELLTHICRIVYPKTLNKQAIFDALGELHYEPRLHRFQDE